MLRGAIIGLGNVAIEGHLPGWARRDDVEIVALSDTEGARRQPAEARLPAARWYDSVEDLLAHEPLDFVDICTPPASHALLVCRALERGLHVLCEKPLVVAPDDLTRVARLAEETRRVVHTVHNWHHAPIIKRSVELVQQGTIGPVTRVTWQTLRTKAAAASNANAVNWRLDPALGGGGVLTDHGWHVFYLLRNRLAGSPTSVSARRPRSSSPGPRTGATTSWSSSEPTVASTCTRRRCGSSATAASGSGRARPPSRRARRIPTGSIPRW